MARRFHEWGIDDRRAHTALLVVSELVANAIRHGSRENDKVELEFRLVNSRLFFWVSDAARAHTRLYALPPSHEREAGRA